MRIAFGVLVLCWLFTPILRGCEEANKTLSFLISETFWRIEVFSNGSARACVDAQGKHTIYLPPDSIEFSKLSEEVAKNTCDGKSLRGSTMISVGGSVDYSYVGDDRFFRELLVSVGSEWRVYRREDSSYEALPRATIEFLKKNPIFVKGAKYRNNSENTVE